MNPRRKALVWVLAVFVAGSLFGTALTTAWMVSRPAEGTADPPPFWRQPRPPQGSGGQFMDRLSRQLELEPEQREQVTRILKESQARFRELNGTHRRQAQEIRKEVNQQLRSVLTPGQYQKFREMFKNRRRRGRR